MGQATAIKDVLAVQAELTQVRGEIERLTAERGNLEAQAAFSTLTVQFALKPNPVLAETTGFDPATEVDQASASLVGILQGLATAGIWFAIVWVPILVALAVAIVIGLWVFRRIQRTRGDSPAPVTPAAGGGMAQNEPVPAFASNHATPGAGFLYGFPCSSDATALSPMYHDDARNHPWVKPLVALGGPGGARSPRAAISRDPGERHPFDRGRVGRCPFGGGVVSGEDSGEGQRGRREKAPARPRATDPAAAARAASRAPSAPSPNAAPRGGLLVIKDGTLDLSVRP